MKRAWLIVLTVVIGCAGPRYERGPRAFTDAQAPVRVVDHTGDNELAWFEVTVRAGSAHDPLGQEGLAHLTAQLLREGGAGDMSPEAVERQLVALGTDVHVVVDREMVHFRVRCLSEDAWKVASMLGDMIVRPGLDEDVFARLESESAAWLERGVVQNDEGLGSAVFNARLYEGHRYGHPTRGRLGVVDVITVDDVRAFLAQRYLRSSVVLGVAGDVAPDVLSELVSLLSEAPAGLYKDVTPRAVPKPDGRSLLIVEKPTESTGIHFGHVTRLHRSHPDWPAMLLAVTALGEHRQSHGRLYRVLREERGLNYGDYAYIENYEQAGWSSRQQTGTGRVQNAFSVWIRPTEAANGPFALKAAIREVENWVQAGLLPDEFARMKKYLGSRIALWASDPGRRLGWATEAVLMGWPDPIAELPEQIASLELSAVNEAIQRNIDPDGIDIVVVTGDGASFRDAVIEEGATPIVYGDSAPPEGSDQSKKDAEIADIVLGISQSEIIRTEEIFR